MNKLLATLVFIFSFIFCLFSLCFAVTVNNPLSSYTISLDTISANAVVFRTDSTILNSTNTIANKADLIDTQNDVATNTSDIADLKISTGAASTRLDNHDDHFTNVDSSMVVVNNKNENQDNHLTVLDSSGVIVGNQIENISNHLSVLDSSGTAFGNSIENINNHLSVLDSSGTLVGNQLENYGNHLSVLDSSGTVVANQLSNHDNHFTNLDSSMTAVNNSVDNINNHLTVLDSSGTTANNNITVLQSSVSATNATVESLVGSTTDYMPIVGGTFTGNVYSGYSVDCSSLTVADDVRVNGTVYTQPISVPNIILGSGGAVSTGITGSIWFDGANPFMLIGSNTYYFVLSSTGGFTNPQ